MEYKARFKSIFQGVFDIVSLIDTDYNIMMVNEAYERLLRKAEGECIGHKCYKIIRNRQTPCEDCPMLNIKGIDFSLDKLIVSIGDEDVSISRHPVYDDDGKITGVFEIGRIITKEMKMQKEIEHQGRLKIMGELAASIVHEIKNPLVGIGLMSLSIMERLEEKGLKDEIYNDMESIYHEIQRLEGLLENLSDFGRPSLFITKQENIHDVIDETLKMLHKKSRSGKITIKKAYNLEIPEVFLDFQKMQQVFLNIFLNAIEAMKEGGEIIINTDMVGGKMLDKHKEDFLQISITDTGTGIKREYLPYIFDPFFTKSSGNTGLGLPIVSRILSLHNGSIEVETIEGKGTTIKINLPIVQ